MNSIVRHQGINVRVDQFESKCPEDPVHCLGRDGAECPKTVAQ